jgi:hypothetical protein
VTEAYQQGPAPAQAATTGAVPAKISYQGMLTDGGSPVNGSRNIIFKLFTTTNCSGTALQTITKNNVAVQDGLFNVVLDVDPAHFNGQALRLRVEIGATALGCEEVLPAPYALFSASTGSLHMKPVSAAAPAPNQVLKWNGTAWAPAADANTTYTAGTGLGLAGSQFSMSGSYQLPQACSANQIPKWTGTAWNCAADADTTYTAGTGLILTTTQFGVNFAGSGSATTVAHSDHNHFGQSWSGSATNGLVISNSGSGAAIYGNATAATGNTKGVYGRSASSAGVGVYGLAAANPGTTSFGVAGHHFWAGTGVGAWSFTGRLFEGRSGDYPDGTLQFYVTNNGNVFANGTYNIFVQPSSPTTRTTSNEYTTLYALQSPEAWFEDFGTGTLVEGKALILIDPLFAATVNLNSDYHVFLTPMGNSNNLYVFNQTPTSFEVLEANDGQASISFHYRIVAKRQGYEDVRLETIRMDESPQLEREEVGPHD